MGARFAAVIFDCDGVLVDSEAPGLEASAAYLRSHNLPYTAADLVRLFTGLRDDVFADRLREAYLAANGGAAAPAAFFDGLVAARRENAVALKAIDGAAEALDAVTTAKAVASSSRAVWLDSKLKRAGLYERVAPHVYSAEWVARGKPHPDIFLYSAERLGVAPDRCLVVEDSANGVAAGVAAGMTVWGFSGGGHCFDGHDAMLLRAGAERVARDFPAFIADLRRS
ncbi:MAG: HAD-IA family hydrolase [Parvularculaceae bacterium]|nr:HAD-IA family hydrolase [Parvularculaceae bacterium]